MSSWKSVSDECSYGIAIYNFNFPEEYKLKLTVGDAVHILDEETEWYYGYLLSNRHVKGIFPKNYIHIKRCERVEDTRPVLKEPPITQEITSVLREWGVHWKNLYVTHNKHFEQMKNQIYDLMTHRSKIISGTLPVDELKRVTKQSAEEIDIGNKILGLDLVVRDKNGNLINPDDTSTIQLFYHHKNATERMSNREKPEIKEVQPKTAIQQYSNIFLLAVRNFTCKMSEDAELLMTLYDGKEFKAITESYVVRWTKEGLMSDLDQMYNLRVMFTDLGKKDLEREKIFLVCYVVRVGAMDTKEVDHRRSSVSVFNKKGSNENMRRPCGVAAFDITNYMNGKLDTDLEEEFAVPFVGCDKDNLEQTLKKIITKERLENKNQALFVSMKLLRGDLKQVREENPHLVLGNVSVARKMGFPEVILPGDVRNDLYLTLIGGEFSKGSKKSEKNVEVTVKVCNDKGQAIPGVISLGGGVQPIDEYRSVIYYHLDRPQWYETFKVAIPIEEFKTSHLKFTFKHRSSNEAKDKSEKPFGMSYVKLMQENGTTLPDARHSLIVYKIDYKKFDESSLDYFKLPSTTHEIKEYPKEKLQVPGLSVSTKDSFSISSNICSTKLTQNVDLLGLLNWASHKETLTDSLRALMKVDGEEVVKFLQDILDALFNILMDNPKTDMYDTLVFECLLHIISLVSNDWKYQHFEPVLDLYIKESFSATLAYEKLISVLKAVVSRAGDISSHGKGDLVFKTMKALQYVMRFVSRSRILYMELYPDIDPDDEFVESLRDLLQSIIFMMSSNKDGLLREQGACLKYLPSTIPDILLVFDHRELSVILCDMLNNIPLGRLTKQKMMTINEIVHSKLFLYPECRKILLPIISQQVKSLFEAKEEGLLLRQDGRRQNRSVAKVAQLLGTTQHCVNQHVGYPEEVELCIKIMSDIMELLFRKDVGPTYNDLTEIIQTDMRTIIQSHIKMERDNPHASNLVAVMIDIFRQMTVDHYNFYINKFTTNFDVLDFLMEILVVFKELVSSSVFPKDWFDMIMLQNSVILKSLRFFSHTIRDCFFQKFEHDAWSNFFHCAIAFMTQEALQLENFSVNKRMRIVNQYKDMRREMGFEIRSMWFNLGQNKVQFVPSLVGLILEMTLIPEMELRKATIPIFFDMMQCEFYSSRYEIESFGDTKRDSSHIKGNFTNFENEMIVKLDTHFEGGKGDIDYKKLFHDIMMELCGKHTTMHEDGIKFVKIVSRLMESLLEYRQIITDENKENTMSCTVNLLDFYSEINKKEMYIRYLNKLFDLHLDCDNFTEAAYTLELHTKLLNWSEEALSPLLKGEKYVTEKTHRQLKETLYYTIIDNYSKGKMWECAIKKCQELAEQYEQETFDYDHLSDLHKRMAVFYDDIMKKARAEPEYFRVGYFGKGFPQFLQNKIFIYRGKEYERLADFNARILNEFPKAELLNKLTPPGEDITGSDKQYVQINKVDPIMDEKKQRFSGKPIADQIVKFYKVNNIQKFTFSRPFTRKDPLMETENEFAHLWLERTELSTTYPLPGILRWFPVQYVNVIEISPLQNAIETMEKTNRTLTNYINVFNKDNNMQINPLSLTLNGILDAAVMGGIKNYEEVFFTSDYEVHHADDKLLLEKLKDLIADQIPLLGHCVQIHKMKAPDNLQPLQKRLEECFAIMKADVEEKYGKRESDIKLENEVQMRRHYSITSDRLSDITITPDRSTHHSHSKSLISSPTKSLTNTPSLSHKKSHKTKEKRRSSKSDIASPSNTNTATQWYTSDNDNNNSVTPNGGSTPIFELTQELHPKRPLRSEVEREKRLSRPSSGQFSRPNSISVTIRGTGSSGASSNRDSIGTTDSSISEEDAVPPPLPAKHRDLENCNSLSSNENYSFLYSQRTSILRNSLQIKMSTTETIEVDIDDSDLPPTPPPKPPKNKSQTSSA
ncbi:dedicator of cytokinesis protein 2 isoform X2 [Anoplophora glabripennis]|uniref:dedicator of cytokinesis protein 2 isoform X2 n=1 Tax=Anoplophora glabripennis TaxID=217634 RepID=UPI000874FF66|nr:dedicator of cytokinesis protein 2 isoform X2 [Anoplophora glabripennis]